MATPPPVPPDNADSPRRNGCALPALIILVLVLAAFVYAVLDNPFSAPDPTRSGAPPAAPARR
jgi:hypothetical protein